MLLVVLAGVAVASIAGAWMGAQLARAQEQVNLRRLASTLADAGFPLTENVLRKMAGLSGADFVVLNNAGHGVHSTISLSEGETSELKRRVETTDPTQAGADVTLNLAAGRYRALRLPVRVAPPGNASQALYVLYPEENWDRVARRAAWPPLVAGLFTGLIAVALTTLLARRFTDRVRQLSEQAGMIAAGDFTSTPLPPTDDELRDLAASLNQMSERLGQYEEQVRRSERLRTLGQLGAGIAHQLRNSATGARMALEFHASDLVEGADRESLDVALRQLDLMEASLKRFLRLGRGERLPTQTVTLAQLVNETLPLVEPSCRHANIRLEWDQPNPQIMITGEPDSLRQLLLNLLVNAIEAATDASGRPGIVRVELVQVIEGNRQVILRVLDSGPGPAPEIALRLFEPFATTKPDGTGLGLSVAHEIARSHNATLSWHRSAGMTCFELCFASA
jgi:signal transduction histidine kinase